MARPCSVCALSMRSDIDQLLADGVSVTALAARYGFSESAGYRHKNSHTERPSLDLLELPDLTSRVAEVADSLRRARVRAEVTSNGTVAVRAAAAELRALDTLSTRLGIDDLSLTTLIDETTAALRRVVRLAMDNPDLLDSLDQHSETRVVAKTARDELARRLEK